MVKHSVVWYGMALHGICQSAYYKLAIYFTLFSTLYEHTIISYETTCSAFKIILLFHVTSFVIRRTITRQQRLHNYTEHLGVSCHLHKLLETTCRKPVTNSQYASRFLTTFKTDLSSTSCRNVPSDGVFETLEHAKPSLAVPDGHQNCHTA